MEEIVFNEDNVSLEDIEEEIHKARAIVINEQGQVLLMHYAGLYMLPGGKIKSGETEEDAVKREIQEESGIDLSATPVTPFMVITNYEANYYSRVLKRDLNRATRTTFYVVYTNQAIDLNRTNLSESEKEKKAAVSYVDFDSAFDLIRNNPSTNPKRKPFDRELLTVLEHLQLLKDKNLDVLCGEISNLVQVIPKMVALERKKEWAVEIVKGINHKYDQQLSSLIAKMNSLNAEKEALENAKREKLEELKAIPWFIFWKIYLRKNLQKELKQIEQSLVSATIKQSENVEQQWRVRPTFEQECIQILGKPNRLFLNAGINYDGSNEIEVRNSLDRENEDIIMLYKSCINNIALKCAEFILTKIQDSSGSYSKYIKVDMETLLSQFGIVPDVFQPDILKRVKHMIDEIFGASTSYLLSNIIGNNLAVQMIDTLTVAGCPHSDDEDITKGR